MQFIDAVSRSLRRGDLLLLVVGDGIREGVGAIAAFLEGHASLHFGFGLIEMAIYQMPGEGLLVQPRVLAQSIKKLDANCPQSLHRFIALGAGSWTAWGTTG